MKYLTGLWDHIKSTHLDPEYNSSDLERIFKSTDREIELHVALNETIARGLSGFCRPEASAE